jgi:putative aldouronate transport system permease protein
LKLSRGEKIFQVLNYVLVIICALVCLLPIMNIFARSLSGISAVAGGKVWIWPVDFNIGGWKYIIYRTNFLTALKNSFFITIVGTTIAVVTTILTAYTLSKPHVKGRTFVAYLYVTFMIFNAGIVPNYFLLKSYGLLNTIWVLILPAVVNPFYMFVLKTSFENIPASLEEAAKIDGASNTRTLISVVVPVSQAAIATIIVFYSVNFWNRYADALMYITKDNLKPVTLFLYEMIKKSASAEGLGEVELAATVSPDIMTASAVVLTVMPILFVYPFMQKYFVKGVMVGSVKG